MFKCILRKEICVGLWVNVTRSNTIDSNARGEGLSVGNKYSLRYVVGAQLVRKTTPLINEIPITKVLEPTDSRTGRKTLRVTGNKTKKFPSLHCCVQLEFVAISAAVKQTADSFFVVASAALVIIGSAVKQHQRGLLICSRSSFKSADEKEKSFHGIDATQQRRAASMRARLVVTLTQNEGDAIV